MSQPLLSVRHLYRSFQSGESSVDVLKNINLDIEAGEMVAIVGQSGSGKSTLMNILGCLDKPSQGEYRVANQLTNDLAADELAQLRREYFGFIFQRYHLLGDLTASENVQIPAIYAGINHHERTERANKILYRLGLEDRVSHTPGQLSGGQQQRVSIARALINGGDVILADEPTGALDSKSGVEVMNILKELHQDGHTIILVTHDQTIAQHANRIIEIKDGEIIADTRNQIKTPSHSIKNKHTSSFSHNTIDRMKEAFKMAVRAILAHRLRSFLTMLGIIIGIASVVSVVALGNGSKEEILNNISSIGTNTINVYRGIPGDRMFRPGSIQTLTPQDADIIAAQPYVDSVSPLVFSSKTALFDNISVTASIVGNGHDYFRVSDIKIIEGRAFNKTEVDHYALEAVINTNARNILLKDISNPIGQVILIDTVPIKIIGIGEDKQTASGQDNNPIIWLPYTSVLGRILGQTYISSISIRVKDNVSSLAAEQAIHNILLQRHGKEDFSLRNTDTIKQAIESATSTMTLLISSIAVISLIVGGIGVMNIMLVSVTERTQEIGVRMAVGARQSDIMQQFLIEAVLICLLGGLIGIALSLGIGFLLSWFGSINMIFSTTSMILAFLCASGIGIAFGFLPAKNAAQLDPVVALTRE